MTDYSKIIDHVINCKVAQITGESAPNVEGWGISRIVPDYCNDPVYAWPLIRKNVISLGYDGISWEAFSVKWDISYNDWKNHPDHPLRIAMILFIMGMELEHEMR